MTIGECLNRLQKWSDYIKLDAENENVVIGSKLDGYWLAKLPLNEDQVIVGLINDVEKYINQYKR